MDILLKIKRADGKIKESNSECEKLENYCEGINLMLNKGFIKAYQIFDADKKKLLASRGNL